MAFTKSPYTDLSIAPGLLPENTLSVLNRGPAFDPMAGFDANAYAAQMNAADDSANAAYQQQQADWAANVAAPNTYVGDGGAASPAVAGIQAAAGVGASPAVSSRPVYADYTGYRGDVPNPNLPKPATTTTSATGKSSTPDPGIESGGGAGPRPGAPSMSGLRTAAAMSGEGIGAGMVASEPRGTFGGGMRSGIGRRMPPSLDALLKIGAY